MRLMSVSLTEPQVRARTKTVTRRLGWKFAKVGDQIMLCRKVMGRRSGEPLVRICPVEIIDIRREPLWEITDEDVAREGFDGDDRFDFIEFFCEAMRCTPDAEVTRIEWRYL